MTAPLQVTECKTAADVMAVARRLRAPVLAPVVRMVIPAGALSKRMQKAAARAALIRAAEQEPRDDDSVMVRIVRAVAANRGSTPRDIITASRHDAACHAKHEVLYRLRTETKLSGPAIAREMGYGDHAAVLYGASMHAARHGLPIPGRVLNWRVLKRLNDATVRKRGRPRKKENGEQT